MELVWPSLHYLSGYVAALERALRQMLPAARSDGLTYVEITTDPSKIASRRVIEANGGILVEQFVKPPQFGSTDGLRFRIPLD